MIKLTTVTGEPVLVNILIADKAMKVVSDNPKMPYCTLIGGVYVRESLEEIQEIIMSSAIGMLRRVAAELAADAS
jgi:hypothetical protein